MDDNDVEGYIARNMFHTDSDSSEDEKCTSLWKPSVESNNQDGLGATSCNSWETTLVRREILDVLVEEQQVGGSIAHRLWPAAQYLAEFVLELTSSSTGPVYNSLEDVRTALRSTKNGEFVPVIELGAGIGLTGLVLATHLRTKVLLTDLNEGLPLLRRNAHINQDRFKLGVEAVSIRRGDWSNLGDFQHANSWYRDSIDTTSPRPLLIVGSDCVYWESLHHPLEQILQYLLSNCPGSVCLLAGMRRWKRDNAFYQNLGKRTRTESHELRSICLKETASRGADGSREIMRVYEIRWTLRKSKV
jgi:hypothetical protein